MGFQGYLPLTEEEIRTRIGALQPQIDHCRKQLEIAESDLELPNDQLRSAESLHDRMKPGIASGRLAGL